MTYEQVKNLKPEDFKRLCGVRSKTFIQMVEVARTYSVAKQKTGRPGKLSWESQILMALEYWSEYRTYFHIGQSWGVNESTAWRIIQTIENPPFSSTAFTLPGKKKLHSSDYTAFCGSSRCNGNSPRTSKKKPKQFYSGKKKKHTLKSQVVAKATGKIIFSWWQGKEHDASHI